MPFCAYIANPPPTITFLQSTNDTANLTTYTFTSQNLGTANANRYIAVCTTQRSSPTLSSVTIGGVSATIVAQANNTGNVAGIAIALVPTGATGDIVVTWGSSGLNCAISVYQIDNLLSATPFHSITDITASPSINLNIPASGIALGFATVQNSSPMSWSGLTERDEGLLESVIDYSSASDAFVAAETGRAISVSYASTLRPAAVFASWA